MKVVGSALIGAERSKVWDALQDPAVLVRTIPGCQRLEAVGSDVYTMTVSAGVASIKGIYQGQVALTDPEEPEAFVLKARGQGAPGTVDATVRVRLTDEDGGTRIDYDADAVVGGMVGGVGQRMLTSVAKKMAGEFFTAVEKDILAVPALFPVEKAQVEEPALPSVFTRAEAPATGGGRDRGPRAWPVLAAFGMGAGIALGSAVIGWLLGRAGKR
ncbi:carbon monoxide dehydrogenase subunit G [Herbidospora galbida]|uniref:Carbon monoxide dehydrogenase subunit G n=1 Tax=Herbidospora galbida TaxID=2575442 RepID=A0A4U3MG46_9ACTN|nr:carbon monoxide dehydrogenase subunit G [Herbidospora galbida]TKK86927.1 carbon monoxide dehydrogenase subunit G [Herbidospora galbida]